MPKPKDSYLLSFTASCSNPLKISTEQSFPIILKLNIGPLNCEKGTRATCTFTFVSFTKASFWKWGFTYVHIQFYGTNYLFYSFMIYLMTLSTVQIIMCQMTGWQWIMKWKEWGRKQSKANLKNYSDICLEKPRKSTKDPDKIVRLWDEIWIWNFQIWSSIYSTCLVEEGNKYLYHISSVSESNFSLIRVVGKTRIQMNEIFTYYGNLNFPCAVKPHLIKGFPQLAVPWSQFPYLCVKLSPFIQFMVQIYCPPTNTFMLVLIKSTFTFSNALQYTI